PLGKLKIKGILWYQGEGNVDNADTYEQTFSQLILSWRTLWKEELPFYYAQIAPYDYGDGVQGGLIRHAQRRVLKLPKTGMVMTSDVGDIHDIHRKNRRTPANRFADFALAEVYDKKIDSPYAP